MAELIGAANRKFILSVFRNYSISIDRGSSVCNEYDIEMFAHCWCMLWNNQLLLDDVDLDIQRRHTKKSVRTYLFYFTLFCPITGICNEGMYTNTKHKGNRNQLQSLLRVLLNETFFFLSKSQIIKWNWRKSPKID